MLYETYHCIQASFLHLTTLGVGINYFARFPNSSTFSHIKDQLTVQFYAHWKFHVGEILDGLISFRASQKGVFLSGTQNDAFRICLNKICRHLERLN